MIFQYFGLTRPEVPNHLPRTWKRVNNKFDPTRLVTITHHGVPINQREKVLRGKY
jgi:hypothetical protein